MNKLAHQRSERLESEMTYTEIKADVDQLTAFLLRKFNQDRYKHNDTRYLTGGKRFSTQVILSALANATAAAIDQDAAASDIKPELAYAVFVAGLKEKIEVDKMWRESMKRGHPKELEAATNPQTILKD
jgi:hypothetical protein